MPQNSNFNTQNNSMILQIVPKQQRNEKIRQILEEDKNDNYIDDLIVSRNLDQN